MYYTDLVRNLTAAHFVALEMLGKRSRRWCRYQFPYCRGLKNCQHSAPYHRYRAVSGEV